MHIRALDEITPEIFNGETLFPYTWKILFLKNNLWICEKPIKISCQFRILQTLLLSGNVFLFVSYLSTEYRRPCSECLWSPSDACSCLLWPWGKPDGQRMTCPSDLVTVEVKEIMKNGHTKIECKGMCQCLISQCLISQQPIRPVFKVLQFKLKNNNKKKQSQINLSEFRGIHSPPRFC